MTKIQLYILDENEEYAQWLGAFIRSSEFAERIQVKLFSQPELIVESSPHAEGVLLMSEAFYSHLLNWNPSLRKIILSETIANSMDTETKVPFLYRFQSMPSLLTRLEAYYAEMLNYTRHQAFSKTRVISLYSSSGSSGKTLTAIHLAKQLAFRGKRVFYLSLESVSGAALWLQGESGRFSQLIYYMKSTPDFLGSKLQLLKSHDPLLRFDYISPNDHIREMQEMKGEQTEQLINALISLNIYDYIIVDLESSVHPRIMKVLDVSDHIIWLLRDDLHDVYKAAALYKQTGTLPSVHFVMNKYTGVQQNDFSGLCKEIMYRLPYIPEWKHISHSQQVWQSVLFSEQTYEMISAIFQDSRHSITGMEGAVS